MEEQINQIREAIRIIVNFLQQQGIENFSDESKIAVTEFLQLATQRIEELQQGVTPPVPTDLNAAPYPSSNINAFKYDPEKQKLFVKFQGKFPQQNGPVYSYDNVPKFIFDVFSRGAVAPKTSGRNAWHEWKRGVTPSLGASMYALVRLGGYPYRRLS